MKLPIAAIIALGIGLATSPARAITLDLGEAVLTDGAEFKGTNIKFAPNKSGSATFTFDSVPNQQYVITVTGHNDSSTSFFNFFIDPDGLGGAPEFQLGGNFTFRPGFITLALPSFIDIGTIDTLRIVNGGTGNNIAGQIDFVGVSPAAVPVPIVGAGLPGIVMALGGFVAWRRRRNQLAA